MALVVGWIAVTLGTVLVPFIIYQISKDGGLRGYDTVL